MRAGRLYILCLCAWSHSRLADAEPSQHGETIVVEGTVRTGPRDLVGDETDDKRSRSALSEPGFVTRLELADRSTETLTLAETLAETGRRVGAIAGGDGWILICFCSGSTGRSHGGAHRRCSPVADRLSDHRPVSILLGVVFKSGA